MGKNKKGDGKIDSSRLLLGGYDRELDRYGVKGMQFGRSSGGQEYRSAQDVEKDVIDAARNDYDLRRTLESAAMSGKKKAKKILDKGFKNIGDVTNAANFSEKAAKRHGQGGAFDSASDYMGLTRSMVERDRNKMLEPLATKDWVQDRFDKKDKEQSEEAYEPQEFGLSETAAAAEAMVDTMYGMTAQSPYSLNLPTADDSPGSKMLNEFKVKVGVGLREAGIPTRGKGAPGTPDGFESKGGLPSDEDENLEDLKPMVI